MLYCRRSENELLSSTLIVFVVCGIQSISNAINSFRSLPLVL